MRSGADERHEKGKRKREKKKKKQTAKGESG